MKKILFIAAICFLAAGCYKIDTYGRVQFRSDERIGFTIYTEYNDTDPLHVQPETYAATVSLNEGNYIMTCGSDRAIFQIRVGKSTRVNYANGRLEPILPDTN